MARGQRMTFVGPTIDSYRAQNQTAGGSLSVDACLSYLEVLQKHKERWDLCKVPGGYVKCKKQGCEAEMPTGPRKLHCNLCGANQDAEEVKSIVTLANKSKI